MAETTGSEPVRLDRGAVQPAAPARHRGRLERLCRYVTRPPIATKRLSVDGQGRVVYRYKQPFRDGSTHVVLEPLNSIACLTGSSPRPPPDFLPSLNLA